MSGKHRCFPDLTFLRFTVADEAVNRCGIIVHFCSQSHADRRRQALSQRTRRKVDTGGFVHIAVRGKIRPVSVQSGFPLVRVKSEIAKHGVHCGACVSFGHNNAVAVLFFGIFRVDVCFVVVNDGKRVHDRHRAADMSDTEVSDNFDCVVTEFSGFCRQEIEFLFFHILLLT